MLSPVSSPVSTGDTNPDSRKPFPQFNAFRQFVLDELKLRKNIYPTMPVTPFVRMTSTCVDDDNKYQFFSLGLHGFDGGTTNIFDLTYGDDPHDTVGTAVDQTTGNRRTISSDELTADLSLAGSTNALDDQKKSIPKAARPMPGITSVSVKRMGLGQPMSVQVQWTCYNRGQLEFLRNHFLIPGNYVILEFGQNFANRQVEKMIDFSVGDAVFDELMQIIGTVNRSGALSSQLGRETVIQNYNKPNHGNYDVIIGQVGNFEIAYEPETGIYKCMTSIISQGENLRGIKIDQTSTNRNEQQFGRITTIGDYFNNNFYDAFIQKSLKISSDGSDGILKEGGSRFADGTATTADQAAASTANVSSNVNDYAFMSWSFLFEKFLPDMLGVIKDQGIHKQLLEFMRLGQIDENEWVGYHPLLLSAEPETLLVINVNRDVYTKDQIGDDADRAEIAVDKALDIYDVLGHFGDTKPPDGDYGARLDEGVWINTGAIRECFIDAVDLRQAFTSLFLRMNRSVGNYWQLQLFSDDDGAQYKVIDYKFGHQSRQEAFYKFNVGGNGECLSVDFDSAFPPELISQMVLVAKFNASTQAEKDKLIAQIPLLGTTSAHLFVLNWSTLRDGLQDRISQWRAGTYIPTLTGGDVSGRNQTTAATTQETPQGLSNFGGSTGRDVGKTTGDTPPAAPADNTRVTPATKTPTPPRMLDTLPVNPLTTPLNITSDVGNRLNPLNPTVIQFHPGVDIAMPSGTPVNATNAGRAVRVETDHKSYGGVVYVQGADGWQTVYGHLKQINIQQGDYINVGDNLGYSGGAPSDPGHGLSTGAHLHYEIRDKKGTPYKGTLYSLDQVASKEGTALQFNTPKLADSAKTTPGTSAEDDTANITKPDEPEEYGMSNTELAIRALKYRRAEVSLKFGHHIWTLTEPNRSDMINRIAADGYSDTSKPNSLVAPYPTTTSTTVEIMGIAGISISDGFFVDKIPFTFEKHGVFQVTEIHDDITSKGWRTKVKGYFKMLWYDANGQPRVIT